MSKFKSPVVAAFASATLTASILGGIAIAQTGTPTVITACVAEQSGNVRIVSDAGACKPNEAATTWNQQGAQGVPGISRYEQMSSPSGEAYPGSRVDSYAECSDGKVPLGGGVSIAQSHFLRGGEVEVATSYPGPNGWHGGVSNESSTEIANFNVFVICAQVAP